MTILEAACQVLESSPEPQSVKQIYDEIIRSSLYQFGAKSPRSVLSGTLRTHIRESSNPRIVEVSSGVYRACSK